MNRLVKASAAVALALSVAACGANGDGGDEGLEKITFATAASAPLSLFQNIYIADELGYFAEEGLQVEFVNTGANAAVTALLDQGGAQIGVGVPDFQVHYIAEGNELPGVNYYEYTYPSKWFLVTRDDVDIHSVADLAGKNIGIESRGTADENVLGQLFAAQGVAADDITMTVVGSGTSAGAALDQGRVDAYMAWDTTLGQFDVAGIGYRILVGPQDILKVGGFYLQATPEYLESNREQAVGFARAVAKATVFALANPEAAADLYLKMYPTSAGAGSRDDQIQDIVTSVRYRAERWLPYEDPDRLGYIQPSEWENELEFAGVADRVTDPTQFYTNDLIDEINDFDKAQVEREAEEYTP